MVGEQTAEDPKGCGWDFNSHFPLRKEELMAEKLYWGMSKKTEW